MIPLREIEVDQARNDSARIRDTVAEGSFDLPAGMYWAAQEWSDSLDMRSEVAVTGNDGTRARSDGTRARSDVTHSREDLVLERSDATHAIQDLTNMT